MASSGKRMLKAKVDPFRAHVHSQEWNGVGSGVFLRVTSLRRLVYSRGDRSVQPDSFSNDSIDFYRFLQPRHPVAARSQPSRSAIDSRPSRKELYDSRSLTARGIPPVVVSSNRAIKQDSVDSNRANLTC